MSLSNELVRNNLDLYAKNLSTANMINSHFEVTIPVGAPQTVWSSSPLADGVYACSSYVSAFPPNSNGISSYRPVACVWVSGGVGLLRGAGISDNIGGAGAGVIANNPLFSVAANVISISAGDAGAGQMKVAGTVTLYRLPLPL